MSLTSNKIIILNAPPSAGKDEIATGLCVNFDTVHEEMKIYSDVSMQTENGKNKSTLSLV